MAQYTPKEGTEDQDQVIFASRKISMSKFHLNNSEMKIRLDLTQ